MFSDESRVTFDGPDGWTKLLILSDADVPVAKGRKRVCSMLIWDGTGDQAVTESLKMGEIVKIDRKRLGFRGDRFLWTVQSQHRSFKQECTFVHGKAPSRVTDVIYEFFDWKCFTGAR